MHTWLQHGWGKDATFERERRNNVSNKDLNPFAAKWNIERATRKAQEAPGGILHQQQAGARSCGNDRCTCRKPTEPDRTVAPPAMEDLWCAQCGELAVDICDKRAWCHRGHVWQVGHEPESYVSLLLAELAGNRKPATEVSG
jgi:nitrate reductase cytochrome c-type subunit